MTGFAVALAVGISVAALEPAGYAGAVDAVAFAQAPATKPAPRTDTREAFLAELQRAVAADDRRAVAGLVQYPITVLVSGFQVPLPDAAAMLKTYDAIFTNDLQGVVAESGWARRGQPSPKYPAIVSDEGLTLGGFLSIQQVGSGFKIVRIAVPPAGSVRAVRRVASRVTFPNGSTSQLSGRLSRRQEVQSYLVTAQKGQSLRVSITGFHGADAGLKVMDPKGNALNSAVTTARTWSGAAPEAGDYRIDVVRTAPDTDPELLFVLSVTLR